MIESVLPPEGQVFTHACREMTREPNNDYLLG
jgi:hypothetical protein